ncbi:hypothetical protein HC031_11200 [Planosporangium thailandense]|uniref:Integral membrane protein n=1 Tax=Planosporangium thailandense TaxID=765197 RepID=A0ABX0XYC6_9ACTN|nr:hypothetical protein [Planosporangium thailandense]NJC70272.1 hypothetical protein [Planosporangium thailandense]
MAIRAALRWLRRELHKVCWPAAEALRRRQWHRFALAAFSALLVTGLGCAFRTPGGHAFVEAYAITRPADGWATVALRLPLSMFAPAALLPFWFAVVQVAVVYGAAQAVLGWWRTVLVAAVGHTLATCSAHLWILLGRPLGVGHGYDHFGDAGPSVAVVTVIAYVAVTRCAGWLVGVLVAYDAIELTVFNGLSQREHLLGAVVGALCAAGRVAVSRPTRGAAAGRGVDGADLVEPVSQTLAARARSLP